MKGVIFKTEQSLIYKNDFPEYRLEIIDHVNCQEIDDWMCNLLVKMENYYKNIFIPLSFGPILSDFLGLRLAAHIRTTPTKNQLSNIYLYGTESIETLINNDFSMVFRIKGVFLIDYNLFTLQTYAGLEEVYLKKHNLVSELEKMQLKVPSNLYDSHSVANIWGMYRLLELEGIEPSSVKSLLLKKNSLNNIYFKWLIAKNSNQNLVTEEVQEVKLKYSDKLRDLKIVDKIDLSKFKR